MTTTTSTITIGFKHPYNKDKKKSKMDEDNDGGGDDDDMGVMYDDDDQHEDITLAHEVGNHTEALSRTGGVTKKANTSSSSSSRGCRCNRPDIEVMEARGVSVCRNCGVVLEENLIVSNIEFGEDGGGRKSVVGQYIGDSAVVRQVTIAPNITVEKESRGQALNNAKREIETLVGNLKCPHIYIDMAYRLFTLAVANNFVQGRRTSHVCAAALYVVCRREHSSFMLIDFSLALKANVFELGKVFLKFTRKLNLHLPVIDPSLFIHRFANDLEFGDQAHVVATTALKIVSRMKRDWINQGRRPSGICAAALIIAARMHGFSRTQKDMVEKLSICEETLRNRLAEFEATPSGRLTMDEFLTQDLPTEADPPSFQKNRGLDVAAKLAAEALMEHDSAFPLLMNTNENLAMAVAASHSLMEKYVDEVQREPTLLMIEGGGGNGQSSSSSSSEALIAGARDSLPKHRMKRKSRTDAVRKELEAELEAALRELSNSGDVLGDENDPAPTIHFEVPIQFVSGFAETKQTEETSKKRKVADTIHEGEEEEENHDQFARSQGLMMSESNETSGAVIPLSDDGDDIEEFLLSESEQKKKAVIWEELHSAYLAKEKEKDQNAQKKQKAIDAGTSEKDAAKQKRLKNVKAAAAAAAASSSTGGAAVAKVQVSGKSTTAAAPIKSVRVNYDKLAFLSSQID
jgi:transcription factor IIIB subunit 2